MAHQLPLNPMRNLSPSQRESALPPVEERSGFSRSGFAPIPHRHSDLPPPPPPPAVFDDRERDWDRGRDYPPPPRGGPSYHDEPEDDHWDGRRGREDYDRRPPPPRWEDEYGTLRSSARLDRFIRRWADVRTTQAAKVAVAVWRKPSPTPSLALSPSCPSISASRSSRTLLLAHFSAICRLVPRIASDHRKAG